MSDADWVDSELAYSTGEFDQSKAIVELINKLKGQAEL